MTLSRTLAICIVILPLRLIWIPHGIFLTQETSFGVEYLFSLISLASLAHPQLGYVVIEIYLLTEYRSGAGVLWFCITMNPINREDWISSAGSWIPRNPGIWRWPHPVPTRTLTLALHTCLAAKWIFFRALLYLWLSPEPSPLFSLASGEGDKSLFRCYKEGLWLTF